ncbi:Protein CBG11659 [Caenorhabditis briggsae]|uniref:Protein CBG11659 n=1 Tax=Caenorhabditis briggsae TaxID=6238 RepID=A8XDR1_CAEBR|nr:Protein CBG11659 [Caenorhabditis briggsae]CAP30781.1 Protein CBG11659 [Caenorhabditis briggsae]
MPAEVKLECIGKMEFKERLSLRCTAKAERSLVDSQKIEFNKGRFWGNNRYLGLDLNNKYDVTKHLKDKTEALELMKYLKKVGVFKNLTISFGGPKCSLLAYQLRRSLHKVAQMRIDTNSKVGTTFQVSVSKNGSFAEFLEHFADRIVSKRDKRVRIRTNNPDRHILLERGLDNVVTTGYYIQFFRLIVISAKMKQSEYDGNFKEWLLKMDPDAYDKYFWENSFDNFDDFYDDDDEEFESWRHIWYDSDDAHEPHYY